MELQAALVCFFDGAALLCERLYFNHATGMGRLTVKRARRVCHERLGCVILAASLVVRLR